MTSEVHGNFFMGIKNDLVLTFFMHFASVMPNIWFISRKFLN